MNSFASRYGVALASAVKHCGNGSHNLIVMHGLLGQKRNFRTFANHQEITSQLRSIHLLDLRNHGESPHTSTMSLNEMADDLREYIDNHTLDNLIILGHSLGGRVLFKFMGNPDFSQVHANVKGVIPVDILPTKASSTKVKQILLNIVKISLEGISYQRLEEELTKAASGNLSIAQLLLTNIESLQPITRKDGINSFRWKINLPAIAGSYEQNVETDLRADWRGKHLVLCGERSDLVRPEHFALFRNVLPENSEVRVIKNAGHWVHSENLPEFASEVAGFLRKL